MRLPALPSKSNFTFRHIVDWPGYALANDASVWEYTSRGWRRLREEYHGRDKVVEMRIDGSFAVCRISNLYEDTYGIALPEISD